MRSNAAQAYGEISAEDLAANRTSTPCAEVDHNRYIDQSIANRELITCCR